MSNPATTDTEEIIQNEQTEFPEEVPATAQKKGLSIPVAAVFIVGTMCGSGILALPRAVVDSGWAGIPLLIICGCVSSFTGNLLGKCWTIVRQRYPEYEKQYIPDPYPTIGFRAAGKWGKIATRACIILTLFGGGTVFLLLIAGNIENLISTLGHEKFYTCYLLLIVVAVLTPFTWLGTPKDFWQAGIIAAVTTALASVLIVVGLAKMAPNQAPAKHSNPDFVGFFNAFGTILFAYGGASCFPTIQIDMENPDKFPVSVVIGISMVMAMYLPTSITGFVVLGDNMKPETNILNNMEGNWILYTVIVLITSHLLMAVLIVANPINQDIEGFFGLPDKFSWKRCLIRTCVMLSMLFVALTIPHFGVILSLVGGTTVAATNFIFPPLFYLLLSRQKTAAEGYGSPPLSYSKTVYTAIAEEKITSSEHNSGFVGDNSTSSSGSQPSSDKTTWTVIEIPLYMKVILIEIIAIGLIGGTASTYSVIASLVNGQSGFTVPCYVNWGAADST